jgi:tRNA-specific 2-thiouridylase
MSRVVLAMSGGVDSSVAAALLREAGHEVIGLFMRHGHNDEAACATAGTCSAPPYAENATHGEGRPLSGSFDAENAQGAGGGVPPTDAGQLPVVSQLAHKQGCCTAADALDARRVADRLGIPFYALNFEREFGRIMDYFVEEYLHGRTPNPCVVCNNWLKFGALIRYADSVGAQYIATGHYARLRPAEDGIALCRGRDPDKDQSYVLFGIDRRVLPRLLFPVGDYTKVEIRRRARQLGLRVADKKDSQEICFVTRGHYSDFVRQRSGTSPRGGQIVTTRGEVVGSHQGIEAFTVGQRKGLNVALGEPYFVVRLEPDTRRVVIGRRDELARARFTACRANWLAEPDSAVFDCHVKTRYRSPLLQAGIELLGDQRFAVRLREPACGIAPGQAVVCYAGDRVLGGGWIESDAS